MLHALRITGLVVSIGAELAPVIVAGARGGTGAALREFVSRFLFKGVETFPGAAIGPPIHAAFGGSIEVLVQETESLKLS